MININNGERFHHIINFPHKKECLEGGFRQQVDWITNNETGLDWDYFSFNNVPLECIAKFLQEIVKNEQFYVKGHQKLILLSDLIPNDIKD